jgi:hypothetical protein
MLMKKSYGFDRTAISLLTNHVDLKTTTQIDGSLIARCLAQQVIAKVWIEWIGEGKPDRADWMDQHTWCRWSPLKQIPEWNKLKAIK